MTPIFSPINLPNRLQANAADSARQTQDLSVAISRHVERMGRTYGARIIELWVEAGKAGRAISDAAARGEVNVPDRDGFTPVDSAKYWATRSPRRALECFATLAVLLCHEDKRSMSDDVADPDSHAAVHRRLAEHARRSALTVPWTDEPWATLGGLCRRA